MVSATIFVWRSDQWMNPGIRSPSSDLWTSWPTHLGWSHCDSACSDSGLRVPCLCRCVLSSMARFSPACLPPCFLPCRSVHWQYSWQCFGCRLTETYLLQLHCFTELSPNDSQRLSWFNTLYKSTAVCAVYSKWTLDIYYISTWKHIQN